MSDQVSWEQIQAELTNAGVSKHNLRKSAVKLLPQILRKGEHIHGALVGRNANRWSAMFVVTNKRFIYIEADLLFHSYDQVSYTAIHGIEVRPAPVFSAVTVFTKIHDYGLGMVSGECADRFKRVIEDILQGAGDIKQDSAMVAETETDTDETASKNPPEGEIEDTETVQLTARQQWFVQSHAAGIVATAVRTGGVFCRPVYYSYRTNTFRILTREHAQKAQYMSEYRSVALSIYDSTTLEDIQIQGTARQITDAKVIREVYDDIARYAATSNLQPLLYDTAKGDYIVFEITPDEVRDSLLAR